MTDTHKDLVKRIDAEIREWYVDQPIVPLLTECRDTIERLTASAPVDGDFRESAARAAYVINPEYGFIGAVFEELSWEMATKVRRDCCYKIADAILALLPARTPEADADVVRDHVVIALSSMPLDGHFQYGRELGRDNLERIAEALAAANLLRAPAVDAEAVREACAKIAEAWMRSSGITKEEAGGQQIAGACIAAEIRSMHLPPAPARGVSKEAMDWATVFQSARRLNRRTTHDSPAH